MTDDLVKRLRNDWDEYDVPMRATDAMTEAADRIEALTADRENRLADLMVDPEEVPDMEMEYDHRAGD